MTGRLLTFLKTWMLPLAIVSGIGLYLTYRAVPALHAWSGPLHLLVAKGQPILISVMLFLQFVKVSPADLRLHRWHFSLLLLQGGLFLALSWLTRYAGGGGRILLECAALCFICPTAAAGGVVTDRLGGDMSGILTYVVLINFLASLLIPAVIPILHPVEDYHFLHSFVRIIRRVFSILLLPCFAAWTVRYLLPRLQKRLERIAHWAFYVWGLGLTMALILATRALALSHIGPGLLLAIGAVSLVCCLLQFAAGRRIARSYGPAESLTAGQALGQKNTGFLIWTGYNFLTPVTCVAGGLYSIWHNLVNSYELYRKAAQDGPRPAASGRPRPSGPSA